jgi:hypothetical protein
VFVSGPWSTEEIELARGVKFSAVLDYLGAYHQLDRSYTALNPSRGSVRVHVNYECRDFRFLLTGEKWLNELLPQGHPGRGGGGAIDFVRHLTGLGFVPAVKVCLDAAERGGQR